MASGDLFRAFTVRFSYKKEQHVRMLQKFEDNRLSGGKAKNQVIMDALEMYYNSLENNSDTKDDKVVTERFLEQWLMKLRQESFFIRTYGWRYVMGKELAEIIEENGIMYHLAQDGCYYPDLRLPEGTHYNIGKYGLMR